jgi:hypothetical protein
MPRLSDDRQGKLTTDRNVRNVLKLKMKKSDRQILKRPSLRRCSGPQWPDTPSRHPLGVTEGPLSAT